MRKVEAELAELGFPVIAVAADRPEKLALSLESKGLGYALYSDSSLLAARKFGIVFQLDDETLARYLSFGFDLEDASGYDHHQLPVPSVFLVGAGGTIHWVYSNADYKVRPENEKLMRAARALAAREATLRQAD
ncbi:MAG: redoxin domain-containing protein [Deltaproteobacteria bacterium]|nr:redoxin domain-containing protein [Deltaproteobacteria bacterium]